MKLFFSTLLCVLAMQFGLSVGQAAETCSIRATTEIGAVLELKATNLDKTELIYELSDQCIQQVLSQTNEPAESAAAECANIVVGGC